MGRTKRILLPSLTETNLPKMDVNMVANIVQLLPLLTFGYFLLEASLAGEVTYDFLAWWSGITALFCGGLTLLLEYAVVTGGARLLSAIEVLAYLFWLTSGYLGTLILDPENTQASLFKTGGVLIFFLVWNGLQLVWRISQKLAKKGRKYLGFEYVLKLAKDYVNRRNLDDAETQVFLQQVHKIAGEKGVSRRELLDTWESLSPSHAREFLGQVLAE